VSTLNHRQRGVPAKPLRILCYGFDRSGNSRIGVQANELLAILAPDRLVPSHRIQFLQAVGYDEMIAMLIELSREEQRDETIVIISLDWLERLVLEQLGAEHGNTSIVEQAGEDQPAYVLARKLWRAVVDQINVLRNERGMDVLLIARPKIERFTDRAPSIARSSNPC
jgi:hypothetical protein